MTGPRSPLAGGIHSGLMTSQAKLADPSSGIFPFVCAAAGVPSAAAQRPSAASRNVLVVIALPSLWPHARNHRNIAVLLAADVVLDPQVVAQLVGEARLPLLGVILRIVDRDDDLEIVRPGPADALDRLQFVGVRRAGRVQKGLLVEARGLDHERVAVVMADRIAVVGRERD